MSAIHWIGAHANKVASAVRAFLYMGLVLNWWHLTVEQQVSVLTFVEVVLSLFVEGNTVSKVRVGERINAEVDRQMSAGG